MSTLSFCLRDSAHALHLRHSLKVRFSRVPPHSVVAFRMLHRRYSVVIMIHDPKANSKQFFTFYSHFDIFHKRAAQAALSFGKKAVQQVRHRFPAKRAKDELQRMKLVFCIYQRHSFAMSRPTARTSTDMITQSTTLPFVVSPMALIPISKPPGLCISPRSGRVDPAVSSVRA